MDYSEERGRFEGPSSDMASEIGELRARVAELEQRLSFTLALGRQVAFRANERGDYLSLEQSQAADTGLPGWQGPNDSMFARAHPDDRDGLRRSWFDAVDGDGAFCHDCRLLMEDGSYRWWRSQAERIGTEPGEPGQWRGLLTDIHQLQRALEDARSSEQRLRTATRATRDVIWDVDLAAQTIVFGETMPKVFGYDFGQKSVSVANWRANIHPDDLPQLDAACSDVLTGDHFVADHRLRRANGDYAYVQSRGYLLRDVSGRPGHITGAFSDLTEERETAQRLEQLQAEMLDSSRSSMAGALAAILAHEINQPLTALTNYVRGARRILTQEGADRDAKLAWAVDAAANSALEAGAIVQRMRDLIARGEGRPAKQGLGPIADDARSLVLLNDPLSGLRIEIDDKVRQFEVIADRVQIHQMLMNLLRNATEALADTEAPRITISAGRAGEFVRVSIADNGPGFGSTDPETLFMPFTTTKEHGVGIGLSICRRIVESGGGQIWAENDRDGGAVFNFTVLLYAPAG